MSHVDVYNSKNYLTLDFEIDTSHGDYGHAVHPDNGILLVSWKVGPDGPLVSEWADEFHQERLLKSIEAADFIIAHNAKYELGWLRRAGLDLFDVTVFDTKIAEYVLLGNLAAGCNATGLPPRSTSLDACCRRRGWEIKDPVVDKMMHAGINPIYIPRPWLQGRCEQDVTTTERLFQDQRRLLAATGRLGVQYTRCMLTPALSDIEAQGMHLDAERVEEQYAAYTKKYSQLNREFDDRFSGINWRSGKQVAELLYGDGEGSLGFSEPKGRDGSPLRTKAGRPKTDKGTIASLKARTDNQRWFLQIRREIGKVDAALTKSLQFFQGVCKELGCIFYAVFNQTVTATHRLSSSGHYTKFEMYDEPKTVQFQNMARIFKPLFSSRTEGWLMVEADGSQLEFRVAADLCDDEQAHKDILDPDFDAHCTSASIMNDIPYEEMLEGYRSGQKRFKDLRTAAKVDTFKPLYGGESGTKKQKKWYEGFKERYSGIAARQEAWVEEVLLTKRLITPWGMRYYWPRAKRGADGYCNVKSNVYNYPVQAFATAEIIPIAVTSLWRRLRDCREGVRLVNTVHDSVIMEVHPDYIDRVRREAIKAFGEDVYTYLRDVYNYEFKVPLGCGITIGTHWSEGAEESYNIWPNGKVEQVA